MSKNIDPNLLLQNLRELDDISKKFSSELRKKNQILDRGLDDFNKYKTNLNSITQKAGTCKLNLDQ